MEAEDLMVEVSEAKKSFGNKLVLDDVNMCVQMNSIYGLLGPSGCGKTILLNCLLGLRPLDSGRIRLAVDNRKDVGYMPQEIALFKEFTIKEVLRFYGTLFGLSKDEMKTRMAELTKVLELPEWNKRVGSLSGGEQRRVSFGAALVHNPKLLVLDEPTVGVDPILSYSIWQYLVKLSSTGRTIIITTHYIEEARNAHKIGLMREGRLLCEDTPENILIQQQVQTLEEAFLKLSQNKEKIEYASTNMNKNTKETPPLTLRNNEMFNWNRVKAQIMKNIIWMKRNTVIMFFLLLLPAMQSFIYSSSFGRQPIKLKFIILSDEISSSTSDLCNSYRHPYAGDLNCTIAKPFTCQYAQILNETFDVVYKYSYTEAKQDIEQNKAWGMVYIQPNFTEAVIERLNLNMHELTDETIETSEVAITMDMSNYIIGNFIKQQLLDDMKKFIQELAASCGVTSHHEFGKSPLKFMDPIFGGKNPLFAHSGLPGFFCSFCFYFTMIFTSGAIMMEKIIGTLERSMAAGMTYLEVVTAHLCVQIVLMTFQKIIMYSVFYYYFDFPMLGDPSQIFVLLFSIEAVGIAYGFLLTELFDSDRLVSYAGIGGTLAVFSLGGIVWPLQGAHYLVRSWVWAFPVSPAVDSYKNIASKGYNFMHPTVYFGFLSCIFWTIGLSLISYAIAKIRKYHRIF
ncbi:unnamed protein product [Nezara viridula]|uniref:ABC transporter domain-containing protein n=1 Tax=Nezara viridula TaxID=85310 RepID=A0A9P0HFN5_NEZVI|nr:unnamed protein product [Nezara viridula]